MYASKISGTTLKHLIKEYLKVKLFSHAKLPLSLHTRLRLNRRFKQLQTSANPSLITLISAGLGWRHFPGHCW